MPDQPTVAGRRGSPKRAGAVTRAATGTRSACGIPVDELCATPVFIHKNLRITPFYRLRHLGAMSIMTRAFRSFGIADA